MNKTLDPFRDLHWSQVKRTWDNAEGEHNYWIPQAHIIGKIPKDLQGTLFRNGPGNVMDIQGTKTIHPIDGDGYVCALTFVDGKVHFKSKFVDTTTRREEQKKGEFLFPGQMGTREFRDYRILDTVRALMGQTMLMKWRDPSNTNVYYWGGKLITCYETKLPHVLDPKTLSTLGRDTFGGALDLNVLSAHPRIDHKKQRLVCFGLKPSGTLPQLGIYEFDKDWNCKVKRTIPMQGLFYSHDFLLTDTYYIFHMTPFVRFTKSQALKIVMGLNGAGDFMKYYEDLPSKIILIPRVATQPILQFNTDPCHIFHFSTCEENRLAGTIDFTAVCLDKKIQNEMGSEILAQ